MPRDNSEGAFQIGIHAAEQELARTERRDWELWFLTLLLGSCVSVGLLVLIFPTVFWKREILVVPRQYAVQLFYGLLTLVVLFNVYVIRQHGRMRALHHRLVQEQMERLRNQQLSLLDPLTEVYNRRYLEVFLGQEIQRAERYGQTFSLVMLDLDGFREINNQLGHPVGDEALRATGRLLKQACRKSDVIVRYGGDEFLLVLPETDADGAAALLKRLRQEFSSFNQNTHLGLRLAFSAGVTSNGKGKDLQELFVEVDQNLYTDKRMRQWQTEVSPAG